MTPAQFARLNELYGRLCMLPKDRWESFPSTACADDDEVRAELLALMRHTDRETRMVDDLEGAVLIAQGTSAGRGDDDDRSTEVLEQPPNSATLIGQRLGNIKVEALIGRGGMGDVYRGWDTALERRVAIKTIRPEYGLSAEADVRFKREARLLSKLDHPNICRVYGLLERAEGDCLVLEFLSGETLRERLAADQSSMEEDERVAIAVALTSALVAAHGQHIVHRDLKPDNVMILADGSVKVLDFGIARSIDIEQEMAAATEAQHSLERSPEHSPNRTKERLDPRADASLTRQGSAVGTIVYMSPEQARGEPVTTASDMFTLGLVLHELWSGENPYAGTAPGKVLFRVQTGECRNLDGLQPEIATLLDELKQHSPLDRPTASQALAALRSCQKKPLRRRRQVLWSGLAAMVLTLVVLALWLGGRFSTAPPLIAAGQEGRVLVLPIVNDTGRESLGWVERGLWAMVLQTLDDAQGIETVRPESVDRLINDAGDLPLLEHSIEELRDFGADVGAELAILPVLRLSGESLSLESRAININGARSEWTLEGTEPTALARDLSASLIRRLRPDAEFSDLRDRFSYSPFANRLYASGLEELRTDGAKGAQHYFEVAIDVDPKMHWAQLQLANSHSELAEFDRSAELAQAVLLSARAGTEARLEVAALRTLSTVSYQRGESEQASELASEVLSLSRERGYREDEAAALVRLGDVALRAKKFEETERYYREALDLRRDLGDRMAEAHSLHTLGVLAEEQGDVQRAEQLLTEALSLEQDQGFRYLSGMTNNSLGVLYTAMEDGNRARLHFERALDLYDQVGARQLAIHTLGNLAVTWQREGNLERAFETSGRGVDLAKEIDSKTTKGFVAFNHSFNALQVGALEEAESSLAIAAEVYGPSDPDVLIVSAMLADRQGDLVRAIRLARESRAASGEAWDDERKGILAEMESRQQQEARQTQAAADHD